MGLFSRFKDRNSKPETVIQAPITGELVALESTMDPAFSTRSMGDGVAIVPSDGTVVAPVSGTVMALFPTGHALGIEMDDGTQVMIHVGIDTVELNGAGFTAHIAQGDHVTAGQKVVSVDLASVRAAGYDPTTFTVVCAKPDGTSVREQTPSAVHAGDAVLWVS